MRLPGPRHAARQLRDRRLPRQALAPQQRHRRRPGARPDRRAITISAKAISPSAPEPASAPALLGVGAGAGLGPPPSRRPPRRLETAIGRQLDIGHSFVPWGAGLGEAPAANVAAGRTPMISFGKASTWRAVAAGRHDRYLAALARSVAAPGRCCSATPGAWTPACGPVRDHLRGRLAARPRAVRRPGRARLLGVVAERGRLRRRAGRRRPVLAGRRLRRLDRADGFNWGGCNGRSSWRDFGPIFKAFYSWGSARAKPLMISGTGTVEDPSTRAASAAGTWTRPARWSVHATDPGGRPPRPGRPL